MKGGYVPDRKQALRAFQPLHALQVYLLAGLPVTATVTAPLHQYWRPLGGIGLTESSPTGRNEVCQVSNGCYAEYGVVRHGPSMSRHTWSMTADSKDASLPLL